MRRKKQEQEVKFKINKMAYLVFVLVASLFMGIGYAKVTNVSLAFEGISEVDVVEDVIITEAKYLSNVDADITNSKINFVRETMIDSSIVLGSVSTSTITYQISVYNNTDEEHMFIGVITDKGDPNLYSNPNIGFSFTKLEEYKTIITPGETIVFELTFKYDTTDVSNGLLSSKLNFRFMEIPKLSLSNEGETLTTDKMYPGYTEEYEFTVLNYDDDGVNIVPMTYTFAVTQDAPFEAKIYDEAGNEVVDGVSIGGDGQTKVEHTYKLKVIWNESIEGLDYTEYENTEFVGNVVLTAVPDESDKYLDYSIIKRFDISTEVSPFYFDVEAASTLKIDKDGTSLTVNVNNYSSDTEYNNFGVDYEIIIEGNDRFTYDIDGTSSANNTFARSLSGGEVVSDKFNINFDADISELDVSESVTLRIVSNLPYKKEIVIPLTIELKAVTITLNANGGSVSPSSMLVYKGKTYTSLPTPTWLGHTFNGWYTTKENGGTKVTNSTEVTTSSSSQTLYARWTSYLLADVTEIGDYVDYEYVYYTNVGTNSSGGYIPQSSYVNWRVLSNNDLDGDGIKEVRLITAGVPMTYVFTRKATETAVKVDVANITTNFFSTAFASSSTTSKFYRNGFYYLNSSGTKVSITSISALKTAFTNEYTQTNSSGVPLVQSITKIDIDELVGDETTDGNYLDGSDENLLFSGYNYLLAVPSTTSGYYAAYYVAGYNSYSSYTEPYHMWNVRYAGAIVGTQGEHGVRPVVTLKENVIKVSGSGTQSSPYAISVE